MDSALKRFFEVLTARFGRKALLAACCAAIALLAAAASGSAAGMTIVLGVCAVFAWIARRKAEATDAEPARLRLVSSIAIPGGARIHEIACGTRRVLVGSQGGRLYVIDRAGGDPAEESDE